MNKQTIDQNIEMIMHVRYRSSERAFYMNHGRELCLIIRNKDK